jgi:hypothetical protein
MLTMEERLLTTLNALELCSEDGETPADLAQLFSLQTTPLSPQPGYEAVTGSSAYLETLFLQRDGFTRGAVVIGVCEDGLPFVLNLHSDPPASILIAGDPGSGKTRLLRAILASAMTINTPEDVGFYIVSPAPQEYTDLVHTSHCLGLVRSRCSESRKLVNHLLEVADRRQYRDDHGPALLMIIDDLADFVHGLDDASYWGFEWLVRIGAQVRIWVMAAQSSTSISWLDDNLLESFPLHVLGSLTSQHDLLALTGSAYLNLQPLVKGLQFYVPCDDTWLRIWLCEPGKGDIP